MNAPTTTPIARTRPTLDAENRARRRCKHNLAGLNVVDGAGRSWTIQEAMWAPTAATVLTIQVERGGPFLPASGFTLTDPWPFACCRGRLDVNGRPRRKGGR